MAELGDRCLQAKQFSDDPSIEELEDLLPEEYYLDAVARACPDIPLQFTDDDKKIRSVVDRVNALFERAGHAKLDKRRPVLVIAQDLRNGDARVPSAVLELGKKVFAAISAAFTDTK